MYAKTYAFALIALWAFNACLAVPAPEAKPCGGCGYGCTVERCHTVPYSSCIPIHTTHRIIPSSNCGYGSGWGGYGGGYGGGWGGYGGWGYGGCGCGCDGGYGGWGNGGWGGYGGWGYGGCGGGYGGWGNGGWGYGGCGCC